MIYESASCTTSCITHLLAVIGSRLMRLPVENMIEHNSHKLLVKCSWIMWQRGDIFHLPSIDHDKRCYMMEQNWSWVLPVLTLWGSHTYIRCDDIPWPDNALCYSLSNNNKMFICVRKHSILTHLLLEDQHSWILISVPSLAHCYLCISDLIVECIVIISLTSTLSSCTA